MYNLYLINFKNLLLIKPLQKLQTLLRLIELILKCDCFEGDTVNGVKQTI